MAQVDAPAPIDQGRADLLAIGEALEGHTAWLKAIEQGLADLQPPAVQVAPPTPVAQGHAELLAIGAALEGHTAWLKAVEQSLSDLKTAHDAQLRDLGRWLSSTTLTVTSLSSTPVISSPELQAIGPAARLVDDRLTLSRMFQVWIVGRWLAQAQIDSDVLISVIVPTRNRRQYLERAVISVLTQRYTALELIIVDDGSTDDTATFIAGLTDARIRLLKTDGIGAAAARNLGLDSAQGRIVTHLDDDNLMDPDWLRGVAWAFARWPETLLLYGARIIEDGPAVNGVPSGAMPGFEWLPFDRARLEQSNYIDMNVIAHRAGIPQARFNAALRSNIEWDMLLRLTAHHAPLELPVIACLYSNYAPNRLSDRPSRVQEQQLVRARVHTTRPMRVLCYTALFPLLSETYIEEEMLALEAAGAEVAFAAFNRSVSPYPVRQPVFTTLNEAIATHKPDVIVVYWASHALGELDRLAQAGRPFALRVHSFDFAIPDVIRLRDHPGCVGVWAFPHHADAIPGVHRLSPTFTTHTAMPEPATDRRIVASVSAGLPKKNWPLLLDAMDQISDLDRVVIMARSNGLEEVPDQVARRAACLRQPPEVRINVPRGEVFELLSHTSVLLYTVIPDLPLGMPMSVIEGLRAGACVVTPDRSEMRALCADGFRPYRNAGDIVAHVRDVMAGGAAIEAERESNRRWALDRFCDPAHGKRFHAELSAALTAWREIRQGA